MSQFPHGWIVVGRWSLVRNLFTPGTGSGVIVLLLAIQVVLQIGLHAPLDDAGRTAVVLAVVPLIAAIPVALVLAARRNRRVAINLDTGTVRFGTTTVPFGQLESADYLRVPYRGSTHSYLRLGSPPKSGLLCVRASRAPELTADEREVVAEMLRRSPIRIPDAAADRFDPTGRYAWMDHPTRLTRDEAVDYVLHTPETGEPARAATPRSGRA